MIMPFKFDSKLPVFAALGLACLAINSLAADNAAPAGQMCPAGAYVIGFDSKSNIVCSAVAGPVAAKTPEIRQTVKSEGGEACPQGCVKTPQSTPTEAGGNTAADLRTHEKAIGEAAGGPVISDVKPRWVVFGARETTIRIIGSGFTADTVVKFKGAAYSASVNAAGTELRVTLETRDLPMGRYALTVSNGDGKEFTRRRALEVF